MAVRVKGHVKFTGKPNGGRNIQERLLIRLKSFIISDLLDVSRDIMNKLLKKIRFKYGKTIGLVPNYILHAKTTTYDYYS